MPHNIARDEVQRLVDQQEAIVAEVLPQAEYDWAHIPGAIHLPLKGWDVEAVVRQLERERPVIVYCHDYQ